MGIGNKTKLQQLISYNWRLVEEDELFEGSKCPSLDDCQDELNYLEAICMNYLLTKIEDKDGNQVFRES